MNLVENNFMIKVYTDGATVGQNWKLWTVKEVWLGIYLSHTDEWLSFRVPGISNNEAEFLALIRGMETCLLLWYLDVEFNCDSQIVINRANGSKPKKLKYANERMDKFQDEVLWLAKQFKTIKFKWIPREENVEADRLSKEAIR